MLGIGCVDPSVRKAEFMSKPIRHPDEFPNRVSVNSSESRVKVAIWRSAGAIAMACAVTATVYYGWHAYNAEFQSPPAAQPAPGYGPYKASIEMRRKRLSQEPCEKASADALMQLLNYAEAFREAAEFGAQFERQCGMHDAVFIRRLHALDQLSDYAGIVVATTSYLKSDRYNYNVMYTRAQALEKAGQRAEAIADYERILNLVPDPAKLISSVFFSMSTALDLAGRTCDAIWPLEFYISFDPTSRFTPQVRGIIKDLNGRGRCPAAGASGATTVRFSPGEPAIIVAVSVNGIRGRFVFDTGATHIFTTNTFAQRAGIRTEPSKREKYLTANGEITATTGTIDSISLGQAEARGVVAAVADPHAPGFGSDIDGLLGLSFIARFNVNIDRTVGLIVLKPRGDR